MKALKPTNSSPTLIGIAKARAKATVDKTEGGDGGDSEVGDGNGGGDGDGNSGDNGKCKFAGDFSLAPSYRGSVVFWPLLGISAPR